MVLTHHFPTNIQGIGLGLTLAGFDDVNQQMKTHQQLGALPLVIWCKSGDLRGKLL
jgi:hypothetical protein